MVFVASFFQGLSSVQINGQIHAIYGNGNLREVMYTTLPAPPSTYKQIENVELYFILG